ncbi:hypothetical protein BD311DRAFT_50242 [Dichomitus squalens]|uniref:Uncharacterized protein n=1 Tax=Dichomitus squalens TaxID=114155 RepID=A0A4Q9MDD0_9APHY|nr:hypothetical protein BD311DRAFT_50242 [Dichomitus squalens]
MMLLAVYLCERRCLRLLYRVPSVYHPTLAVEGLVPLLFKVRPNAMPCPTPERMLGGAGSTQPPARYTPSREPGVDLEPLMVETPVRRTFSPPDFKDARRHDHMHLHHHRSIMNIWLDARDRRHGPRVISRYGPSRFGVFQGSRLRRRKVSQVNWWIKAPQARKTGQERVGTLTNVEDRLTTDTAKGDVCPTFAGHCAAKRVFGLP